MFLYQIPNIQNILQEVYRVIQNGPFDIHVSTLGDVYVNGGNVGGGHKIKQTNITVADLNVKLSFKNKNDHWSDVINLSFNNIPVNLNTEHVDPLLIDITDYFKNNY